MVVASRRLIVTSGCVIDRICDRDKALQHPERAIHKFYHGPPKYRCCRGNARGSTVAPAHDALFAHGERGVL
jgi:hypothetical protein